MYIVAKSSHLADLFFLPKQTRIKLAAVVSFGYNVSYDFSPFHRTFPNCKYGNKCLFIHPQCKYDSRSVEYYVHIQACTCPQWNSSKLDTIGTD